MPDEPICGPFIKPGPGWRYTSPATWVRRRKFKRIVRKAEAAFRASLR